MVARVKPIGISGVNSGRTTKVFADFNKSLYPYISLEPFTSKGLEDIMGVFHDLG